MRFRIQSRRARLVRRRMMDYCEFLRKHAAALAYQEYRPMRSFDTPYMQLPDHPTDCSESSAMVARAAGAPVPWVKAGEGYTGTALAELRHIQRRHTRRGDYAVFTSPSRPDGVHMVILLQGGVWHPNPMVWSHGRPGVDVMPLRQMRAGFPGDPVVFLRSVPLDY